MSRLRDLTASSAAPWLAALLVALSIAGLAGAYDDPRADDLRIDVVAPQEVVDNIAEAVQPPSGDTFDFRRAEDADVARAALEGRESFGTLVVGQGSLQFQYAGANGATLNNRLASVFQPAGDVAYTTTDVLPLSEDDPAGLAVFVAALAATVAGVVLALVLGSRAASPASTVGGLALGSVLTGAGVSLLLTTVYDALPGSVLVVGLLQALLCLAVASVCLLGRRLLGGLGLLLASLVLAVLGLATTGVVLPVELLSSTMQALGAVLPPGVAARATSGDAYFGGADVGVGLVVLVVWCAVGLGALALLARRRGTVDAA